MSAAELWSQVGGRRRLGGWIGIQQCRTFSATERQPTWRWSAIISHSRNDRYVLWWSVYLGQERENYKTTTPELDRKLFFTCTRNNIIPVWPYILSIGRLQSSMCTSPRMSPVLAPLPLDLPESPASPLPAPPDPTPETPPTSGHCHTESSLEPVLKHLSECFQRLVSDTRGLLVQLENQRQEQTRWHQELLAQWLQREERRQRETAEREERREKARMDHEIRVLELLTSLAREQGCKCGGRQTVAEASAGSNDNMN